MTLPALPAEGELWWYTKRAAFDAAVQLALENRLSAATLALTYAPLSHNQASTTITDFQERVQDIVGAMAIESGSVTVDYDDAAGTLTFGGGPGGGLSSLAEIGTLLTAMSAGTGLDIPIAYATAYALGVRPGAPTNWKFRIYGGAVSDPDPTWMTTGDYRQIAT